MEFSLAFAGGRAPLQETVSFGSLRLVPLGVGEEATITLKPSRQVDVGAGRGESMERKVRGGVVGVLLDARGRPLQLPTEHAARIRGLIDWHKALNLYPFSQA